MTESTKIEIDPSIKQACYKAIVLYCHDCGVNTTELNKLVENNNMTNDKLLAFRTVIKDAEKISKERKDSITDLISIISDIDFSVSSLFLQIIKYLEKMRTGWWFFTTGNSRLKHHFNKVVFTEFNAAELDAALIKNLKAQNGSSNVPIDSETATKLRDAEQQVIYLKSQIFSFEDKIKKLKIRLEERNAKIINLLKQNKRLIANDIISSSDIEKLDSLYDSLEIELKKYEEKKQALSENDDVNFRQKSHP